MRSTKLRFILSGLFGIVAAGLVFAVTLSAALKSRAPEMAIALWPWNAEAYGSLASQTLIGDDTSTARNLARHALRQIPGDAVALRVAGSAEEAIGDRRRGARIMDLATRASRHDLLTNLWFIEANVARGDIAGAVKYYDYSLKSSAESEQLLFPVLVPAMSDPNIARAVTKKLELRPVWTTSFLQYAFSSGTADAQLIPIVLHLARQRQGLSRDLQRQYAQRLAERGNIAGLELLAGGLGRPLINGPGRLDAAGDLPPADWQLSNGTGASVSTDATGFSFVVSGGSAALANRFVHLLPGAYRLKIAADTSGTTPDAQLRWAVTCVPGGAPIAVATAGLEAQFDIPSGRCAYQNLSLILESDRLADGGESTGSVTRIQLDRIR